MTISSAGNLSRVSSSLRTFTLISQLQQNSVNIFREEQRISSGRQLLSAADNPISAEKITRMLRSLEGQDQILSNLQHADSQLAATDVAITEVSDLLNEAARIASEQASNLQSAEERTSQSIIVDGLIDQLMNIANRTFQDRYMFGGRRVDQPPINTQFGRTTILADQFDRRTLVDFDFTLPFTVLTSDLFNLREEIVGGYASFDVQLDANGRLNELNGAFGNGVEQGVIEVVDVGAGVTFQVDFGAAETVGDLIARFNDDAANAGSTLVLGINPADRATFRITGAAGDIQVNDIGQGTTAASLGIRKTALGGADLNGDNVQRRATLTTLLSDLQPGGFTLPDGVTITNGDLNATIDFTGATTVQEALNLLNGANVGIRADITEDGKSFFVENLISGTPLVIGENGGTDAEALGIRTLDPSVSISRLNGGRGIHPVAGKNDIRITDTFGVAFEVDLSTAQDIGDIISAINSAATAAGATITAEISTSGGGLQLTGPAGPNPIVSEAINLSPVAGELGIAKTGSPTLLDGDIVGEFKQTGIFSALYRLRDGLLADDSSEITEAGRQINELQPKVANIAGKVGARSRDMQDRLIQTESAVAATTTLLSELRDVDFVEAVTKFQQAQTALQSSLLTGSRNLNLSLLDFLR
ncbi:MAG: hypothetical protein MI923_03890 [Phycisphaerales bacterium]|nr:hypothetical protein [Phycisphaerales bacterium]